MPKILIRSARIIDANSPFNQQQKDILIDKGVIVKIANKIAADTSTKIIEEKNLHVSPGWMDLRVDFAEPGHEYKEGILSGLDAAAYGGFTAVVVMPSTTPAIDNRSTVEFLKNRTKNHVVKLLPAGAVSVERKGQELAEMYDMKQGGAVAFTDDKRSISNNRLLFKALTYCQAFDGLIMDFPMDLDWVNEGQIHEGEVSTLIGMKGIPEEAEAMIVARDLSMLEYTGGKLHIGPISSTLSVDLIRKAKRKGLNVTTDTTQHNLYLSDQTVIDFDSNFKLMPPLRDEKNKKALLKGLKDGTIDVVSSDHKPQDYDEKKLEFGRSSFGAIGLETAFSVSLMATNDLELTIDKFVSGPRKVLGLDVPSIKKGVSAEITIFDPQKSWEVNKESLHSKSLNSPYLGKTLQGKAIGVIRDERVFLS
jgi:dihydroorotase